MKILNNLGIIKTVDADKPFGATIKNETETEEGTPVVAELLADPINNLYRLIELAKITPTNQFDGDSTQYQIVEALQKLPNTLNDIERVLTLTGTVWSVDIDFDLIPRKYFFFARASENYVAGTTYYLRGSNVNPSYHLTSSGFKSGDELLVIVDKIARVYNLSSDSSISEAFTVMGLPLAFNDTNKMWYQDDGRLISDVPSINDLQSTIRLETSDGTIVVNDIFVLKGFVLCYCFSTATGLYSFYQFDLNDLSFPVLVDSSLILGEIDNYNPYIYTDGSFIYITNNGNNTSTDNVILKLDYDVDNAILISVLNITINNEFVKTTNSVIKNGLLYTMIDGALESYSLTSSAKTSLGTYSSTLGQIFSFNGQFYFTNGDVAKKWF